MLMDTDQPPSFCKIILSRETVMNKMQLPSCFVKDNKKILSKNCLLKTSEAGMSWEAKIARKKPNYFICEKDWPQFVLHHQVEPRDILIFSLIEKSTLHVRPYTPKNCRNITRKRQLSYEELSSSSSSEEEIGPSKRVKKMEPIIVVSDTEEEYVDMSFSDDDEDDPPYSHRATY
uniref:TF-B3 domain-containing protein n=1 Tax=Solanum lycopersicum TaxID=4081 RepID=K4BZ34_SOLLC